MCYEYLYQSIPILCARHLVKFHICHFVIDFQTIAKKISRSEKKGYWFCYHHLMEVEG